MNFAIVGAGIAGLVAAWRIRELHPNADITVIEKNISPGGLLRGIEYPEQNLYFDQGTHIFQETGIEKLDALLTGAVNEDDLLIFPSGEGDLAGIVFDGQLQSNTHFPDLRNHHDYLKLRREIKKRVASGLKLPSIDRTAPLLEVASARFGPKYSSTIIGPMLERAYGIPAEKLAGFAMLLPGLSRVVIAGFEEWKSCANDDLYRAIIGFPEQRKLPKKFQHQRRSYYSRHNGSRAFIEGLMTKLQRTGVIFQFGANIVDFNPEKRSIEILSGDQTRQKISADGIVLAAGVIGAASLLGYDISSIGLDPPMPHWVIDIELTQQTTTDLCYAYGLDQRCDWYRLTNYRAFSGDSSDRRISVEILGNAFLDENHITEQVCAQLHEMGLLRAPSFKFSAVRRLSMGFPAPTICNMRALTELGDKLNKDLPDSILLGGIGTSSGIFFQNEIVPDIYNKVEKLI